MFLRNSLLVKSISLLILVFFSISYFPSYSLAFSILGDTQFSVPTNLGKITDSYKGKSSVRVICIQDLHCQPEVQRNISKIIALVHKKYGKKFKFIGIEGTPYGEIDTSIISALPEKLKADVIEEFVSKGEISGAELSSLYSDIPIMGLENEDIYFKNLNAFYKLHDDYYELQFVLDRIKSKIAYLKSFFYPEKLLSFESKLRKYKEKKIEHIAYLKFLEKESRVYLKNFATIYPNISKILKKDLLIQSLIPENMYLEFKNLLKNLQLNIPIKSILKNDDYLDNNFYVKLNELKKIVDKYCIYLGDRYKHLSIYFKILDLESNISETKLLHEEKALVNFIKKKMALDTKRGKDLFEFELSFEFLISYFQNKMSSQSIDKAKAHKENFYNKFQSFGINFFGDSIYKKYLKILKDADHSMTEFYKLAQKRDEILVRNLLADRKSKVKVIVAGGFHDKGIREILRAQGISYISIRPNMESGYNEKLYIDRLKRQGRGEEGYIDKKFGINAIMVLSNFYKGNFYYFFENICGHFIKNFKTDIHGFIREFNSYLDSMALEYGVNLFTDKIIYRAHIKERKFHIEFRKEGDVLKDFLIKDITQAVDDTPDLRQNWLGEFEDTKGALTLGDNLEEIIRSRSDIIDELEDQGIYIDAETPLEVSYVNSGRNKNVYLVKVGDPDSIKSFAVRILKTVKGNALSVFENEYNRFKQKGYINGSDFLLELYGLYKIDHQNRTYHFTIGDYVEGYVVAQELKKAFKGDRGHAKKIFGEYLFTLGALFGQDAEKREDGLLWANALISSNYFNFLFTKEGKIVCIDSGEHAYMCLFEYLFMILEGTRNRNNRKYKWLNRYITEDVWINFFEGIYSELKVKPIFLQLYLETLEKDVIKRLDETDILGKRLKSALVKFLKAKEIKVKNRKKSFSFEPENIDADEVKQVGLFTHPKIYFALLARAKRRGYLVKFQEREKIVYTENKDGLDFLYFPKDRIKELESLEKHLSPCLFRDFLDYVFKAGDEYTYIESVYNIYIAIDKFMNTTKNVSEFAETIDNHFKGKNYTLVGLENKIIYRIKLNGIKLHIEIDKEGTQVKDFFISDISNDPRTTTSLELTWSISNIQSVVKDNLPLFGDFFEKIYSLVKEKNLGIKNLQEVDIQSTLGVFCNAWKNIDILVDVLLYLAVQHTMIIHVVGIGDDVNVRKIEIGKSVIFLYSILPFDVLNNVKILFDKVTGVRNLDLVISDSKANLFKPEIVYANMRGIAEIQYRDGTDNKEIENLLHNKGSDRKKVFQHRSRFYQTVDSFFNSNISREIELEKRRFKGNPFLKHKNVVFVFHGFWFTGGVETYSLLQIAYLLARNLLNLHIIFQDGNLKEEHLLSRRFGKGIMNFYSMNKENCDKSIEYICNKIINKNIDLVVTHTGLCEEGRGALLYAEKHGIPSMLFYHGGEGLLAGRFHDLKKENERRKFMDMRRMFCRGRADITATVSKSGDFIVKSLTRKNGLKDNTILLGPMFNMRLFSEEIDEHKLIKLKQELDITDIGDDTAVFLLPNRIHPDKGNFEALIAIHSVFSEINKDFRVVMIGSVPRLEYFDKMKEYMNKHEIEDKVIFKLEVPQEELLYYYAASDMVMLFSKGEGMPLVMLEAQAAKRAVMASRIDSLHESFLEGSSGVAIDILDENGEYLDIEDRIKRYKKEIRRIFISPDWKENLKAAGEEGMKYVKQRYDPNKLIRNHEDIMASLMLCNYIKKMITDNRFIIRSLEENGIKLEGEDPLEYVRYVAGGTQKMVYICKTKDVGGKRGKIFAVRILKHLARKRKKHFEIEYELLKDGVENKVKLYNLDKFEYDGREYLFTVGDYIEGNTVSEELMNALDKESKDKEKIEMVFEEYLYTLGKLYGAKARFSRPDKMLLAEALIDPDYINFVVKDNEVIAVDLGEQRDMSVPQYLYKILERMQKRHKEERMYKRLNEFVTPYIWQSFFNGARNELEHKGLHVDFDNELIKFYHGLRMLGMHGIGKIVKEAIRYFLKIKYPTNKEILSNKKRQQSHSSPPSPNGDTSKEKSYLFAEELLPSIGDRNKPESDFYVDTMIHLSIKWRAAQMGYVLKYYNENDEITFRTSADEHKYLFFPEILARLTYELSLHMPKSDFNRFLDHVFATKAKKSSDIGKLVALYKELGGYNINPFCDMEIIYEIFETFDEFQMLLYKYCKKPLEIDQIFSSLKTVKYRLENLDSEDGSLSNVIVKKGDFSVFALFKFYFKDITLSHLPNWESFVHLRVAS